MCNTVYCGLININRDVQEECANVVVPGMYI